jgi:hypothetical protein
MGESDKFNLSWNSFQENIRNSLRDLRNECDFFDDIQQIEAHKLILSASSSFFKTVLKNNPHQHPLIYLKGIKMTNIKAMIDFMYHGQVEVGQEGLNEFLAAAEELKVKGLTNGDKKKAEERNLNEAKIIGNLYQSTGLTHPVLPVPAIHDNENIIEMDEDIAFSEDVKDIVPYEEMLTPPSFVHDQISLEAGLYQCKICGKKSNRGPDMKRHVETHSQAPSYACQHCSKMCNTKIALNMHTKRNHSNYI